MGDDPEPLTRRAALKRAAWGLGLAASAVATPGRTLEARPPGEDLVPRHATTLKELRQRLGRAPRRRDFQSLPMILTEPNQWDHEALAELQHYSGGPKQVWDNTGLASPWLNLMRNAMNCQVWAFRHPDFLAVSATHGSAHLALYDDAMWDKYLKRLNRGKWRSNEWIREPAAAHQAAARFNAPHGVFSPDDNSITVLQRRGAVFLACHNEVWELSTALRKKGINPDHLSHERMAAELTNHLIPGVVLTPGIVGTLPELQRAGFEYAK